MREPEQLTPSCHCRVPLHHWVHIPNNVIAPKIILRGLTDPRPGLFSEYR
ncbi:hypothetical protein G7009_01780 [Pseudomonas capeferrum]|nr:hypothetical protein [Pseudomonas capeferrum]MBA1200531.1 hypothetical protein [Pseudomonas capeferrum]